MYRKKRENLLCVRVGEVGDDSSIPTADKISKVARDIFMFLEACFELCVCGYICRIVWNFSERRGKFSLVWRERKEPSRIYGGIRVSIELRWLETTSDVCVLCGWRRMFSVNCKYTQWEKSIFLLSRGRKDSMNEIVVMRLSIGIKSNSIIRFRREITLTFSHFRIFLLKEGLPDSFECLSCCAKIGGDEVKILISVRNEKR